MARSFAVAGALLSSVITDRGRRMPTWKAGGYVIRMYPRDHAPLRPASDAVQINSDGLSADEVYERVLALCH